MKLPRVPKVSCVPTLALLAVLATGWFATTGAAEGPQPLSPVEAADALDRLLANELGATSPAPLTDDATFLRRVFLDLTGQVPTADDVTRFLLDPDEKKRQHLVERLLNEAAYGENWARYWRDVILARLSDNRAYAVAGPLTEYLAERFNRDQSWAHIATEFITATGMVSENGATAIFVAQEAQTEESAAELCRVLLGIQIQCAQCHDHPHDRWTREDFHHLAAFFPRVGLRRAAGGQRSFELVAVDEANGGRRGGGGARNARPEHFMSDINDPAARGTLMEPLFFLTQEKLPVGTPDAQRRETIAAWFVASPWFSKALVNRLWAELVGEGFCAVVDDLGPDRPVTAPQSLDFLAEQFAANGYSLKWALRTIVATQAYQRQSQPRRLPDAVPMTANVPQRLRSDQLFDALRAALELPEPQPPAGNNRNPLTAALNGPRTQFSLLFGYDPSLPRDEVAGSIPQALFLMNAPQIAQQIDGRSPRTMLGRLLGQVADDEAVVVELYLRTLARQPRDSELKTCLAHVESVGDRAEAFEDILWALINSSEFLHRN